MLGCRDGDGAETRGICYGDRFRGGHLRAHIKNDTVVGRRGVDREGDVCIHRTAR